MDWLRTALIASIAFVCFLLVIRWNDFQQNNAVVESPKLVSTSTPTDSIISSDVPTTPTTANEKIVDANIPGQQAVVENRSQQVQVKTDVLNVTIDTKGGDIVRVTLPSFYNELNKPEEPFVLLNNTVNHTYIARSGLIGKNGTDTNQSRPIFSSTQNQYILENGQSSLNVDLTYQQSPDVLLTKRFSFTRESHLIGITYIVHNQGQEPWQATIYGQIKRDSYNPVVSAGLGMKPFLGAATSTTEKNYDKLSFDDIADDGLKHQKQGGWVAMVQHYFLSAWIPSADDINSYELFKQKNSEMYFLQFTGQPFIAAPGAQVEKSVGFYAGPKDIRKLEKISPYLDLTVDYSFLWWIAKPLFFALEAIHGFAGNWGLAIILLTICIKIIFFYPSAVSYRSMAKMRKIQPKMAELKERFGDDRQKFSAEMMKMYRQEKVNPLAGCLPILIQMPVFLALYWVLMESVQLRQAPLFLWIQDLSVQDPLYILPLIMGATMWIQQKLNPTPPDPMQAKVMQMMPIFFTFLFLFFPAGLVLYWVVNNTLSITQQYIITKQIENQK
jgi:YidC/Oxa1 family membrane protein insertase